MSAADHGIVRAVWDVLRKPLVPGSRAHLGIGWWILVLFAFQVLTGTMLSFYYEASPDMATESVRYIMHDVGAGWLVRGLHVWCTHAMILLGLLQMARVLLRGTYLGPGAGSWVLGCLLMFLIVAFASTGQILPWDEAAFGAAHRSMNILETVPYVGGFLATVLRGGGEVASATLTRAYSVHVLLLPWASFFLVLLNLWFLAQRPRKGGG